MCISAKLTTKWCDVDIGHGRLFMPKSVACEEQPFDLCNGDEAIMSYTIAVFQGHAFRRKLAAIEEQSSIVDMGPGKILTCNIDIVTGINFQCESTVFEELIFNLLSGGERF